MGGMSGLKILVVDDESVIVQGIVSRIEKMECFSGRVLGAASGDEALKIMEYFKPDLLIADIEMPGMDGLTLLSIVREKNLCGNCIILTAFESFQYARKAVQYRATDYLLKPVDWTVMENYIQALFLKAGARKTFDHVLSDYSSIFKELQKTDLSYSFKRILKFITLNYGNDISLKQLSIYSGMSENSICNLFKKEMGITFLEYIYQLRLKKAMEILLTEQKKPIKEVSSLVGYNSERQFFRMFKSHTGMTPQRFREKNLYEQGL
jgi:two-component system, response regulator YesN